jgi:hypothetical protein
MYLMHGRKIMADTGKSSQKVVVEFVVEAIQDPEEKAAVLISEADAMDAMIDAMDESTAQEAINTALFTSDKQIQSCRVVDHVSLLRSIRDRLLEFDEEEKEIGLLYDLNETIDNDPFSVGLSYEEWQEWEEYKRFEDED